MKTPASRSKIQHYKQCTRTTFSVWRIPVCLSRRTEVKHQSTMQRRLFETRTERSLEPSSYFAISRSDGDLSESAPSCSIVNGAHGRVSTLHEWGRKRRISVLNQRSRRARWEAGSTTCSVETSRGRRASNPSTAISPAHSPVHSMNSKTKSIPTTASACFTLYAKRSNSDETTLSSTGLCAKMVRSAGSKHEDSYSQMRMETQIK